MVSNKSLSTLTRFLGSLNTAMSANSLEHGCDATDFMQGQMIEFKLQEKMRVENFFLFTLDINNLPSWRLTRALKKGISRAFSSSLVN